MNPEENTNCSRNRRPTVEKISARINQAKKRKTASEEGRLPGGHQISKVISITEMPQTQITHLIDRFLICPA